MPKLFDVVGVSRIRADLPYKLRVANGKPEARRKVLDRCGHVDVMLVQLPAPVTKEQALEWLKANYPDLATGLKVRKGKETATVEANEADDEASDVGENEVGAEGTEAAVEAEAPGEAEVTSEAEVEVTDAALSPAAKAALRRVRDAARKREKRAAAKAAAAASTEAA